MTEYKQLGIFEKASVFGCGTCICKDCLHWWSDTCKYGSCYDDLRAKEDPYDIAHPNDKPRTTWTDWRTQQAYWCRGGVFYPQYICSEYVHYEGQNVKECLGSNVMVFQDGYILCPIIDNIGCESCYEWFCREM